MSSSSKGPLGLPGRWPSGPRGCEDAQGLPPGFRGLAALGRACPRPGLCPHLGPYARSGGSRGLVTLLSP